MGIKNDCRKNAEGYSDPTAYEALRNIEQEEDPNCKFFSKKSDSNFREV